MLTNEEIIDGQFEHDIAVWEKFRKGIVISSDIWVPFIENTVMENRLMWIDHI